MEKFSFELSRALAKRHPVGIIAWGGPQSALPTFFARTFCIAFKQRSRGHRISGIHLGDALLAPVGVALARALKVPVTVTAHGLDITYRLPIYQAVVPRALGICTMILCNSTATRCECLIRGIPEDRCQVIPCGVSETVSHALMPGESREQARARIPSLRGHTIRGPLLLSVGRLVPRKGAAWFVENVYPALIEHVPGVGLWLVGEGPETPRITRIIEQLHLGESVHLSGRLSDVDVQRAYAASDAFVMPNVRTPGDPEGFGIAALEASVAGLWVYASQVDGIPDAIHDGENGSLLPAGDAAAWIDALAVGLNQRLALHRLGQIGREVTRSRFSYHAVADRYVDVFRSLGMLP